MFVFDAELEGGGGFGGVFEEGGDCELERVYAIGRDGHGGM